MTEYTFLVADDDADKRKWLSTVAAEESHLPVVEAVDGKHAIDIIRTDLRLLAAFIDYEMPFHYGPEVIKTLREVAVQRKYTFRALTALTSGSSQIDFPAWREEAMKAGADECINIHSLSNPDWIAQLQQFARRVVRPAH